MANFKVDSACGGLCESYSRARIEHQRDTEKERKRYAVEANCGYQMWSV